ncbi:MAG: hypothetical protein AB2L16_04415 [Anaerolineaceae bacterium]|jgi:hypothetical protein
MTPEKQLSFDQLPADIQSKLKSILQDNEEILFCYYRKNDPEAVELLTDIRVISLHFPAELLVKRHSNAQLSEVYYSDIMSIREFKYVSQLRISALDVFYISIYGKGQDTPVNGIRFSKMDEVYNNYLAILRKKTFEAKMSKEKGELKADKSLSDRLTELKALLENELISRNEYDNLREKILKEFM